MICVVFKLIDFIDIWAKFLLLRCKTAATRCYFSTMAIRIQVFLKIDDSGKQSKDQRAK